MRRNARDSGSRSSFFVFREDFFTPFDNESPLLPRRDFLYPGSPFPEKSVNFDYNMLFYKNKGVDVYGCLG